jgi:hypothetical protein
MYITGVKGWSGVDPNILKKQGLWTNLLNNTTKQEKRAYMRVQLLNLFKQIYPHFLECPVKSIVHTLISLEFEP